ncbi:MAG: hypothetical protein Q4G60_01480 [bacterium]|nr:hypothetical protein [bacterium]
MVNKRVRILDCTLRDGGRCFDNMWGDDVINALSYGLNKAGIDIIEIGFLRFLSYAICRENTSNFRYVEETYPFLYDNQDYVAYIEYVVFKKDHYVLPVCDNKLAGIRLGLRKDEIDEAIPFMQEICEKGYKLFVQGVNVVSYSEAELKYFIDRVNEIHPYAFAIVDTYGILDQASLLNFYNHTNAMLDKDIAITFHSHNNQAMSLELASQLVNVSGERDLILDATLRGIGMGAGNLAVENISRYLNEVYGAGYDEDEIDMLSKQYIDQYRNKFCWKANEISSISGKKRVSQINLSYLRCEYRNIGDKAYSRIIKLFPVEQGMSTARVDELYKIATDCRNDDLSELKNEFENSKILIVGKGSSIHDHKDEIEAYIKSNHVKIIYINHREDYFEAGDDSYYWYMTSGKMTDRVLNYGKKHIIAFYGIGEAEYNIACTDKLLKNVHVGDSIIIVLNLLIQLGLENEVSIVGMDGENASIIQLQYIHDDLKTIMEQANIRFLTDSMYWRD